MTSIYMTYIINFVISSALFSKKFKFYLYVLKIKSYLIGVKKLWYKDDCIYLKKYMVNIYVYLLQFF